MKYLFSILFMAVVTMSYSQNAAISANGNYVALTKAKINTDSITGKSFTTTKGESYPVYKSSRGKIYIWRTSRNSKRYKQYLKV